MHCQHRVRTRVRRVIHGFVPTFAVAYWGTGVTALSSVRPGYSERVRDDSAAFAAVVRDLTDASRESWRIDPRPLTPDPRVTTISAATRAAIGPEVLRARAAFLSSYGVRSVDALALPPCDGGLSLAPATDPRRRGCPHTTMAVAAVALLNAAPRSGRGEAGAAVARGRSWTRSQKVRIVVTYLTPAGASSTVYDFIMRRVGNAWRVLRRVPLEVHD